MTKQLIQFILEARKRGFSDNQIREAILNKGYPTKNMIAAFQSLSPKFRLKNQVSLFLSDELLKKLQKRADKNMLTLSEQIEDILRRSCINSKKRLADEKLDDKLVGMFSRKK